MAAEDRESGDRPFAALEHQLRWRGGTGISASPSASTGGANEGHTTVPNALLREGTGAPSPLSIGIGRTPPQRTRPRPAMSIVMAPPMAPVNGGFGPARAPVDYPSPLPRPPSTPEPAAHGYLGEDLEDVARSTPLTEGSIVELPLILLRGVVLFPGETLPLRLYNQDYVRLIQSLVQSQRGMSGGVPTHLGVLNIKKPASTLFTWRQTHTSLQALLKNVGTTAEICSAHRTGGAAFSETDVREGVVLKAKGRHRFRVVPSENDSSIPSYESRQGVLWARVMVLPEDRVPSLSHLLPVPRPVKHLALKSDRFQATFWSPRRVMTLHSPEHLVQRAQAALRSLAAWNGVINAAGLDAGSTCSTTSYGSAELAFTEIQEPIMFSYRLGANLPLDDDARQQLLSTDLLVQRLRKEISILEESANRALCCSHCRQRIASKGAVFPVPGAEGAVGAYVNPEGFVHQTVTLRELMGPRSPLVLEGPPVPEHTWFPGYAWTMAHCRRCHMHMGWRFTRNADNPSQLETFWGIRRAALMDEPMRDDSDDDDDARGARDQEMENDAVGAAEQDGSDVLSLREEDDEDDMYTEEEEGEDGTQAMDSDLQDAVEPSEGRMTQV